MPAGNVVAIEILHCQAEKVSAQCDLLSCDNDLNCCKHTCNTTCIEVFHEYFHQQEQANLGNMIIHSLIHGGGNSASLYNCCITKRFQEGWAEYTRLQVKWWKYKIVSMRLLQVLKYANGFRLLWRGFIFISIWWAKLHNDFGKYTDFWQTASNSGEQKAPDVMLKFLFAFFDLLVSFLEHIDVMCPIVKGWGSNNAFNTARTTVWQMLLCA